MRVDRRSRTRILAAAAACAALAVVSVVGTATAAQAAADGIGWTARKSAADNEWTSLAYGNGVFVAVSNKGAAMSSPDGINWTSRSVPTVDPWTSVAYGKGRFVAVSGFGGGTAMTSTDGITWTSITIPYFAWESVTYGAANGGTFVAVSWDETVASSTDGINWTNRTSSAETQWESVTYGDSGFVAVGRPDVACPIDLDPMFCYPDPSLENPVMVSADGITWENAESVPSTYDWHGVTFGGGKYVAVGDYKSMTSTDGRTWTEFDAPRNEWRDVAYGDGTFVAVAEPTNAPQAMKSTDGQTWTTGASAAGNQWSSVAYAKSMFVAVSRDGTGNRVMTSNDAFVNQVKSSADNTTPTHTIQLVPASGTTPGEYVIYNNTAVRLNKSPNGLGGTPSTRWAIWGYKWADKTLTLANSNTIPISLVTYQNAGSCTTLGMPAKDCPRPLGALTPGTGMPFRASYKVGNTWDNTPIVTISRSQPG